MDTCVIQNVKMKNTISSYQNFVLVSTSVLNIMNSNVAIFQRRSKNGASSNLTFSCALNVLTVNIQNTSLNLTANGSTVSVVAINLLENSSLTCNNVTISGKIYAAIGSGLLILANKNSTITVNYTFINALLDIQSGGIIAYYVDSASSIYINSSNLSGYVMASASNKGYLVGTFLGISFQVQQIYMCIYAITDTMITGAFLGNTQ